MSQQRIPQLDGLRGIAILLVIFDHYIPPLFTAPLGSATAYLLKFLVYLGGEGVDLFFSLSGFLIANILLANRAASNYFKVFYWRRLLRIFPLYYLLLSIFFTITWCWPQAIDLHGVPWWSYLIHSQNLFMAATRDYGPWALAPTWSLAIEEQFYFLAPLLIYMVRPAVLRPLLIMLMLSGLALRLAVYAFLDQPDVFSYLLLPTHADSMLLGVWCAVLLDRKHVLRFCHPIVACVLICTGVLLTARQTHLLQPLGFTLCAMGNAMLLLMAVEHKSPALQQITTWAWLRKVGILAYGLYLIHFGMLQVTHYMLGLDIERGERSALATLIAAILSFVLAWILYRSYESPLIKIGHRLSYRQSD